MKTQNTDGGGRRVPRVLLTDTNRWVLAARLAMSLVEAGCEVAGVCPKHGHALEAVTIVRRLYCYRGLHPLGSLQSAIEDFNPDLIIPCCDRSVEHLHELHAQAMSRGDAGRETAELIERSLGPATGHAIASSRYELLEIASGEDIRVPRTRRICNAEDLDAWRATEGYPAVMKADGTWGGVGVRLIGSAETAEKSFHDLRRTFALRRAVKRVFINRDRFWLRPWWKGRQPEVILQAHVTGRPANCAVAAWRGRVLSIICVEVVSSDGVTGPASVVCVVDNREMRNAAEKIAARLQLSGLFGLDFVIEKGTAAPFLIEMNPRSTPPCHLRLGKSRDLPGALWAELAGQPLSEHPAATRQELVAYFPHDPKVPPQLLQQCFQDVPSTEPGLIKELQRPFPERTLLFRLVQRLTSGSRSDDGGVPFVVPEYPIEESSTIDVEGSAANGSNANRAWPEQAELPSR